MTSPFTKDNVAAAFDVFVRLSDESSLLCCSNKSIQVVASIAGWNENWRSVLVGKMVQLEVLLNKSGVLVHIDQLTVDIGYRKRLLANRLQESNTFKAFLQACRGEVEREWFLC